MKINQYALCGIVSAVAGFSSLASAQTAPTVPTGESSGEIQVKATVLEGCAINTSSNAGDAWGVLDFGQTSGLWNNPIHAKVANNIDGGDLAVTCSGGVESFTFSIDGGLNVSGTARQIANADASTQLPYNIYQDAAHSQEYGIGDPVTFAVSDGQSVDVPIFGVLEANTGTAATAGAYTDTLRATLEF